MTSVSLKKKKKKFFAIAHERIFIKTHNTEIRFVIGPEKYTVSRRVSAIFSPEILQAGAVNGLRDKKKKKKTTT